MKKGKLVILSAPSGTGKTSICKELLRRNQKWKFSVSATTREKRKDEVDGVDYYFMTLKQFEHKENFGEFLEWQFVHGNRYATPIDPIEQSISNNEVMLLDIDVKGSMNIIEEFEDDVISIFIEPPGFDNEERLAALTERLKRRDGQSETLINQRLKRYNLEMEYKEKFMHHFINDNFEKTTVAIENKIKELMK
ncbi:MAG: guanylate kinase [Candidatus Marinimicrobia bacterium]|nr:guanylate kinase [Candidatus Neomarinimicrobiota bacterium]|tara:strand:- start:15383 stop:15964 length:582 start_codon:yes stop_codon:yes gene_type:complete